MKKLQTRLAKTCARQNHASCSHYNVGREESVIVPQLPLFIKLRMMCDYEVSQENFEELGMVQGLAPQRPQEGRPTCIGVWGGPPWSQR